jgi:hypothetical protein
MEYRVSVIILERPNYVQIVNLSIKNVQCSLNILKFYALYATLNVIDFHLSQNRHIEEKSRSNFNLQ